TTHDNLHDLDVFEGLYQGQSTCLDSLTHLARQELQQNVVVRFFEGAPQTHESFVRCYGDTNQPAGVGDVIAASRLGDTNLLTTWQRHVGVARSVAFTVGVVHCTELRASAVEQLLPVCDRHPASTLLVVHRVHGLRVA